MWRNGVYVVSEGANRPTASGGVDRFLEAGILFGPGKAANAGGVATSGLEMAQNSMRISWTREEVDARLLQIMQNIHEACVRHGKRTDGSISYADGANVAGFVRVADATLARGGA